MMVIAPFRIDDVFCATVATTEPLLEPLTGLNVNHGWLLKTLHETSDVTLIVVDAVVAVGDQETGDIESVPVGNPHGMRVSDGYRKSAGTKHASVV
jgi:hypothetical protein